MKLTLSSWADHHGESELIDRTELSLRMLCGLIVREEYILMLGRVMCTPEYTWQETPGLDGGIGKVRFLAKICA